jgi:hypothetical protein
VIEGGEHGARVADQALAVGVGRKAAGPALEQAQAEHALQPAEQARGRGLGHAQAGGGAMHVALLVERHQQQHLAHLEPRAQEPVRQDPAGGRGCGSFRAQHGAMLDWISEPAAILLEAAGGDA